MHILEELEDVAVLLSHRLQRLVEKDAVVEKVLLKHVARGAVDAEQPKASLVAHRDRGFTSLRILHCAPHEDSEDRSRVCAQVDALRNRQKSTAVAEVAHKLELYEVDVHNLSIDEESVALDQIAA